MNYARHMTGFNRLKGTKLLQAKGNKGSTLTNVRTSRSVSLWLPPHLSLCLHLCRRIRCQPSGEGLRISCLHEDRTGPGKLAH